MIPLIAAASAIGVAEKAMDAVKGIARALSANDDAKKARNGADAPTGGFADMVAAQGGGQGPAMIGANAAKFGGRDHGGTTARPVNQVV